MPGYEPVKNLDKNNAQQAIVLEAVALALALDSDAEVRLLGCREQCQALAARHIRADNPASPVLTSLVSRMQGVAADWLGRSCRLLVGTLSPHGRATANSLAHFTMAVRVNHPYKRPKLDERPTALLLRSAQVLRSATALLAKFISTREPNIKYLGLETLMRLVEVPAVVETIDKWGPCSVLLSHFTSFLLLLTQAWRSSCAWWMCQPWRRC